VQEDVRLVSLDALASDAVSELGFSGVANRVCVCALGFYCVMEVDVNSSSIGDFATRADAILSL